MKAVLEPSFHGIGGSAARADCHFSLWNIRLILPSGKASLAGCTEIPLLVLQRFATLGNVSGSAPRALHNFFFVDLSWIVSLAVPCPLGLRQIWPEIFAPSAQAISASFHSLNDKPIAVLEGAGHIAKRLNLDLQSLLSDDQKVRFKITDKVIPKDTILSMYSAGCDIEEIADELYCTPEQVKSALQRK